MVKTSLAELRTLMSQDSFTKPSGALKLSVSNFTNSFEIVVIMFNIVVTYDTTVKVFNLDS